MKAIVCEMCGSQDLIKQDGMYVCQNCGTKYDTEEAKKLIVEIKADNSEKLKNLYQVARRARDNNDSESAAKNYELILNDDPNSWEAYFYSVYYKAMQTKIAYITSAANSITNALPTVFSLIYDTTNAEDVIRGAVTEVFTRIRIIGQLFESSARDHFTTSANRMMGTGSAGNYFTNYLIEYIGRNEAAAKMLNCAGDCIIEHCKDDSELCLLAVDLWKARVQLFSDYVYAFDDPKKDISNMENTVCQKIRKHEPEYKFPLPNTNGFPPVMVNNINRKKYLMVNSSTSNSTNSTGGCYVATAIYGSYDCPQVWTLRRYRDNTLAGTWYGRAFIHTYYAISPTLVKLFGQTEWFRKMWKPRLDRMVSRLNENGVLNTPYQDRQW